jgi:putative FmdB family regulatory protein
MPIYEYKCRDCGTRFEALRAMKDADASIVCEHCTSVDTVRVLSTCYTKSAGGTPSQSSSAGCGGCAGGSCSSCSH